MEFTLSTQTRASIAHSTGMTIEQQTSTPIRLVGNSSSAIAARFVAKKQKDSAPRGSIYLQMGRILSLKKVQRYIKSI